VSRPADVVSDVCTVYDDPALAKSWPQATSSGCPVSTVTTGDVSEVLKANGYASGQFTYQPDHSAVYDTLGRVLTRWDGNGNATKTAYTTSSYGLTTRVTTTNPLGQSSSITLDPERGLTVSTSDINGITTQTYYDGLGRAIDEWDHSRYTTTNTPPPDVTFTYTTPTLAPAPGPGGFPILNQQPWAVTTYVLNDAGGYTSSTTIYDSLLRVRQLQDPSPAGGSIVTDTFYNSRGQAWKTNNRWASPDGPGTTVIPVADSSVPDQTVTAYDGLGRPILATSYYNGNIKSQTATAYDQLTAGDGDATITVPLGPSSAIDNGTPFTGGTATATVTDALGRTSELDQYTTLPTVTVSSTSPTTVTITGGTTQTTSYTWDNPGRQATVTDEPTGQAWVSDSDLLGQVTSRTDPDSGTTSMLYDGNGNLTQTKDANGATLTWTYDALNRKTAEYDTPAGTQARTKVASWVYDNSNLAIIGMSDPNGHLTTSTRYIPGGGTYTQQATGFDQFGNLTGQTITLNGTSDGALDTSYNFTYTDLSVSGDPFTAVYQASPGAGALPSETVNYGYDFKNGIEVPTGIAGLNSYGYYVYYTALGQVHQEIIGSQSAQASLTDSYDPHTGLLTDASLQTADITSPVDDTQYTYDPAGNPRTQTETRNVTIPTGGTSTVSETQCFGYDALDRLTQAWTATDGCKADPSSNSGATVGDGISGAAYWTTWKYNPLGLRTTENDHGLGGAADTATSYSYDGNSAGQPDTLTSTNTTGGDTGTASYTYDADGNVKSRTITDTATTSQQLTWNDDGTLQKITSTPGGTSSYVYDAGGNLVLQKDPGVTTLYLPGEQLTLDTTTKAVDGIRYYPLPGGGMAVRTGTTSSGGSTSTSYYFELTDQHSTATLSLGSSLTAKSAVWREFTPYGAPRGAAVTWLDNHGFLGKPDDTTVGLTNVGARWYDPATGTFESPDPVFEAGSPQQQNGYTYAADNPATNSDPTGLLIPGCTTNCGTHNTPSPPPPPDSYASYQPAFAQYFLPPADRPDYITWLHTTFVDLDTYATANTALRELDAIAIYCGSWAGPCPGGLYNQVVKDRWTLGGAVFGAGFGAAGELGRGEAPSGGESRAGAESADIQAINDLQDLTAESGTATYAEINTEATQAAGAARFIANNSGDTLDTSQITIPEGKFGYLLKNPSKAGVFSGSMGFDQQSLNTALWNHLVTNFGDATESVPMTGGGTKFSVTGPMVGPSGEGWNITSAWGIDPGGLIRLITATP
jgi:RHS repeat-associated protein